ncbi:hypothetical protein FIM02_02880 [SAR202 cluster bacterium AD-802-E10_MRT_200m]|nr:hypothetical protein [SAR202 cluster bacterium AD-802-E10_MRT_200m]
MSKLVQTIDRVGKSTPAPMGFVRSARSQEAPQLLVISATADLGKTKEILSDAVPDALFFNVSYKSSETSFANMPDWEQLVGSDIPWGVLIDDPSSTDFNALKTNGCDFIVVKTLGIPVSLLQDDSFARILQVPKDFQKEEAHALEDLPIDVVYLIDPIPLPISLQTLMEISAFRNEIPKPVMLSVTGIPSAWELECLRNIGIECVLIDSDSYNSQSIVELKNLVKGLPKRKARNDRMTATLPEGALGRLDDPDDQDDEDI